MGGEYSVLCSPGCIDDLLIWKYYADPVTVLPSKWIAPLERLVAFPSGVAGWSGNHNLACGLQQGSGDRSAGCGLKKLDLISAFYSVQRSMINGMVTIMKKNHPNSSPTDQRHFSGGRLAWMCHCLLSKVVFTIRTTEATLQHANLVSHKDGFLARLQFAKKH
ncbi:hypothetical protein ANANG_G00150150 [Anguilla anguilla]|uniref:Uncharacterized protein n=1 Tax=Anguilla anguilla TaxID=7936 RepID=A0A9D3M892_ANGAN|nr:hypothetical protein ANANG_G00150150 [Anguilla anguilla]